MRQFTPRMHFQILFVFLSCSIFHWRHCGIPYFFQGAVLDEKFAKQNDHFKEFLYSNVLSKVLWYTMVTRRNKFSQQKKHSWQSVLGR